MFILSVWFSLLILPSVTLTETISYFLFLFYIFSKAQEVKKAPMLRESPSELFPIQFQFFFFVFLPSESNNQGGSHIRQQSDPTNLLQPSSQQAMQAHALQQAHHAHARPKMKTNGHFTPRMRHACSVTEGTIQEEDEMLENTIPNRPSMGTQVHRRPSKGVSNSKSMDNSLMITSSAQQEVTSAADFGEYQFYLQSFSR